MPSYELAVILRKMSRPELVTTLKRTGQAIFEKGGIIRKIENLGTRELPYRMRVHNHSHTEGSYFLFKFDAPTNTLTNLHDSFLRDIDILRPSISKVEPVNFPEECTLEEELQPPAYRKSVEVLLKQDRKKIFKKGYKNLSNEYI
ncbi:probable 28S ribosomal protein S6, mitochondrial [Limulus polyphemus]|uniref:Small ribosomal subunit protein bS6m n=1 Tax=Limulus polyphemus TaxID=6850 RepID=A0ABM1BFQ1_LIMPO|nr:probable 28S ribosomal protein S6, mitochondrial [Limulus polyphemus]